MSSCLTPIVAPATTRPVATLPLLPIRQNEFLRPQNEFLHPLFTPTVLKIVQPTTLTQPVLTFLDMSAVFVTLLTLPICRTPARTKLAQSSICTDC